MKSTKNLGLKFGKIYNLKYKIGIKNKTDLAPEIILIQETEQRLIGININYYPPLYRDMIIKLFNEEIFKRFSFDNELLMEALERQKNIEMAELARLYMANNADNKKILMQAAKPLKIKSSTRLLKLLEKGFRIYKKDDLDL